MPAAFFRVPLSVQPTSGGMAELVVPEALRDLAYHFVLVKEGGDEGIVRVEAPEAELKRLDKEGGYDRLTSKQLETVRRGYPPPKLKTRYRPRPQAETLSPQAGDAGEAALAAAYEVDAEGNPVIDTVQTVRAGFYLLDVPVIPPADRAG